MIKSKNQLGRAVLASYGTFVTIVTSKNDLIIVTTVTIAIIVTIITTVTIVITVTTVMIVTNVNYNNHGYCCDNCNQCYYCNHCKNGCIETIATAISTSQKSTL